MTLAPEPVDPEALFARARAGDGDRVIMELREHVRAAPDDFDAWLTLGMICAEHGHVDRARVALAHAVAVAPRSLLARVAYAKVLAPRQAKEQLEAALTLAPDHAGLQRELAAVVEGLD